MKNNKLLIGIGCIVLLAGIAIGVYKRHQQPADDNVIRIGAILPLTGSIAVDGEELLVGVKLAQQDVDSLSSKKVVIDVEDGQFDPKISVNAYNKLRTKRLDALIVAGDGPCEAVAPLINRDSIVTMAPLTGSLKVQDCSPWMFRCWFYVPYVAQYAARFLKTELTNNTVAVFFNDTLYGNLSSKSFQKEVLLNGGSCEMEAYPFLATSLRNEAMKLLHNQPEGVFITGFGLGFITAVNQVKEMGYNGLLITDNALADVMVLNGLKDPSNIYFVDLDFLSLVRNDEQRIKSLTQRYSEITGKKTISNQSILAYEAVMALVRNYSRNPEVMKDSIIHQSSSSDHSFSDHIVFASDGEVELPLVIKQYNADGSFCVVSKGDVLAQE